MGRAVPHDPGATTRDHFVTLGSQGDRPPRRITMVISSLQVGGAELVMAALANRWVAAGTEVTILTFSSPGTTAFFRLDPRVTCRDLDLFASSRSPIEGLVRNLRRLLVLRRGIRATKPDVVISFMDRTNILTLLSMVGTALPVIVSERVAYIRGESRAWDLLRWASYRRAAAIVVQTRSAGRDLPAGVRARGVVIPNPVLDPAAGTPHLGATASGSTAGTPTAGALVVRGAAGPPRVVALGRLVPSKGFSLLLRAFAIVVLAVPGARLEIWGDGPERATLEREIHALGLVASVTLAGVTHDPTATLGGATAYVLCSLREGFPNALLEAMAAGVPPVAFDSPHGAADIIRPGYDGLLVPSGDVDGLAAAIVRLLGDQELRDAFSSRGPDVADRFSLDRVGRLWDTLTADVAARSLSDRG